jgi:hypothetical protein
MRTPLTANSGNPFHRATADYADYADGFIRSIRVIRGQKFFCRWFYPRHPRNPRLKSFSAYKVLLHSLLCVTADANSAVQNAAR